MSAFENAAVEVKSLTSAPTNDEKLEVRVTCTPSVKYNLGIYLFQVISLTSTAM